MWVAFINAGYSEFVQDKWLVVCGEELSSRLSKVNFAIVCIGMRKPLDIQCIARNFNRGFPV